MRYITTLFSLLLLNSNCNDYHYVDVLNNVVVVVLGNQPAANYFAPGKFDDLSEFHDHVYGYLFNHYYDYLLSGFSHVYGPDDNLDWIYWAFVMFCEQHVLMRVARWKWYADRRWHADCDASDGYDAWKNRSYSYDQLAWRANACAG